MAADDTTPSTLRDKAAVLLRLAEQAPDKAGAEELRKVARLYLQDAEQLEDQAVDEQGGDRG